MTADKTQKLVRMANQIGDFYAAMPEPEATKGAASHLTAYWTPKMIEELLAAAQGGAAGLNPTAARAVASLQRGRAAGDGATVKRLAPD